MFTQILLEAGKQHILVIKNDKYLVRSLSKIQQVKLSHRIRCLRPGAWPFVIVGRGMPKL
jgi:hypothetical protein